MKPDGGPAFPIFADSTPAGNAAWGGMSLRDYFAAAALPSVIDMAVKHAVIADTRPISRAETAAHAYVYADAMLAERAK